MRPWLSRWNYFSLAAGVMLSALFVTPPVHAAGRSHGYDLKVLDQPVAVGAHSEFNVQMTNTSTGSPVENAKIMQTSLEMPMMHRPHKSGAANPGMRDMGGEVKLVGSPAPGVYRLMGDISMSGRWKLDVVAAVPGEAQPVELTSTFEAGQ